MSPDGGAGSAGQPLAWHTGGMTSSLLTRLPQLIAAGQAVAAAAIDAARDEGMATWAKPNLVYRGDNLLALAQLVLAAETEPATRAKLIYLDPPYDSGADYRNRIETSIDGNAIALTQLAYRDRWADGTDGYLRMLIPRLELARQLLAEDGALIVHLDWHASHLVRIVLDELFGRENFVNQLVWAYRSGGASRTSSVPRKHDELLLYRRSQSFRIRTQRERQLLDKPFMGSQQDAAGNYYVDTILRDVLEGVISLVDGDDTRRISVRPVLNVSAERTGYATQKPEGLLELLLRWCTDEGDLVVDAFAGSGTTAVIANRLGRRFVAMDASGRAEVVTRSRLDAQGARYRVHRQLDDSAGLVEVDISDGRILLRGFEPATAMKSGDIEVRGMNALAGWAVWDAAGDYAASWRRGKTPPAAELAVNNPVVVEAFDLTGRVTNVRFDS